MAVDTFLAYSGVYSNLADALFDYDAIHALHSEAGLIDAYDAAVLERKPDGDVKIVKKHETPTRVGGVAGAGVGLATGLAIAPLSCSRHRWRPAASDWRWRSCAGCPRRPCGSGNEP